MRDSTSGIVGERLRNQKLVQSDARDPVGVVSWLGAVQSQDYAGAKWALSLRVAGLSDADVDKVFDSGALVRTHVLRPTWHFVAPADIRWMLTLTGPRILAGNRLYCRKNGLDEKTLARSRRVLEKALTGARFMTRQALGEVLARAGIACAGQGLAYVMMDAELQQVVCSGPRQGKQFTYALLDERAPRPRVLKKDDEALAELTRRYFSSHGPATVADFVWWSGLTVKLAKAGLEMLGRTAVADTIDGCTYWSVPSNSTARKKPASPGPIVHLLPNYDELMNALRDRRLFEDPAARPAAGAFDGFPHQLAIDGKLRGAWRRTSTGRAATIEVRPFRPLSRTEKAGLADAVARYGTFLNLPARLLIS